MIDKNKKALMPCHPARARELLRKGKAAVYRRYPFTIILKARAGGETQPVALKVDPGSKTTGIALVGAFVDGKLVGVASVYHEAPAGYSNTGAWRLHGMATLPEVRGQKYGVQMLKKCIAYVAQQGAAVLWCNSRLNATGFYESLGFEVIGNPFQLQGHGLRYFMERRITEQDKELA